MVLDRCAPGNLRSPFCLGRRGVFFGVYPAGRRDARVCRRQTVDVEISASRGAARDQYLACSSRPADQAADDFRRRHPQLFRAGVSDSHGCVAAAVYVGVVSGDPARRISFVLFAILRDEPRRDGGPGDRDAGGRVPELAEFRCRRFARASRPAGVSSTPVLELPQCRFGRPRPRARRTYTEKRWLLRTIG